MNRGSCVWNERSGWFVFLLPNLSSPRSSPKLSLFFFCLRSNGVSSSVSSSSSSSNPKPAFGFFFSGALSFPPFLLTDFTVSSKPKSSAPAAGIPSIPSSSSCITSPSPISSSSSSPLSSSTRLSWLPSSINSGVPIEYRCLFKAKSQRKFKAVQTASPCALLSDTAEISVLNPSFRNWDAITDALEVVSSSIEPRSGKGDPPSSQSHSIKRRR